MGSQNSLVGLGFYTDLLGNLLLDIPSSSATARLSRRRDIDEVNRRAANEGFKFLTTELPKLGKALDLALEARHFDTPSGFKLQRGTKLPCFMHDVFCDVFDADGALRDDPDPNAVRHLRQVFYVFYKLELPYSREQEDSVLQKFREIDESLLTLEVDDEADHCITAASYIVRQVFQHFDPRDIVPGHGPGAVATGERGDDKWNFSRLYDAIHQRYPYYDFFIVGGPRELLDRGDWYRSLQRLSTGTAKVITVPKDSRGPRIISEEPLEYQFIQQGLMRKLVPWIETHYLTRGQVNFTDQSINGALAYQSSIDGIWATLDLAEASDRVSLRLVERVFSHSPELLASLLATRSTHTMMPDGAILELRKFAPMGSALCFPVESIVFWALCVAAISRYARADYREWTHNVFVYGDDIIVPATYFDVVVRTLEGVGLKVNTLKSYRNGSFRESCGVDAFKGVNVTPTRVKTLFSGKPSDGSAFAAYVATANQLELREYRQAASYLWKKLEDCYGRIPCGTPRTSFPCRIVSSDPSVAEDLNLKAGYRSRYNTNLQRIEFQVKFIQAERRKTTLDGWHRLLRNCTISFSDSDPSVVVVPRSTKIKRGWRAVG